MLTLHEGTEHTNVSRDGKSRTETIDLADNCLLVDISDAVSERDKVKFSVHTKTTLPDYKENEFTVCRQHEEFIWLHDVLVEREDYSGFIIPPPPPRPNFDASREKLQKLGEGEGTMTKEEFNKMKQELEAEYLATFKKTVAMHEVFLQRLAAHPKFRTDHEFKVFLEYDNDLSVRGKNRKEKLAEFFTRYTRSADDIVLTTTQKDIDEFFDHQKGFLSDYNIHIKDCTYKSDKMTRAHKNVADCYIKISSNLTQSATNESELDSFMNTVADCFEKARKIEGRVSSDEDLKLSDTLRYYYHETMAAKELLYRRLRCLANYEAANRNLDKARIRNKDIQDAENQQQEACEKFENISKLAKAELNDFKVRRVASFRKNFVELAELEIKHAKAQVQLLNSCLTTLRKSLDEEQ